MLTVENSYENFYGKKNSDKKQSIQYDESSLKALSKLTLNMRKKSRGFDKIDESEHSGKRNTDFSYLQSPTTCILIFGNLKAEKTTASRQSTQSVADKKQDEQHSIIEDFKTEMSYIEESLTTYKFILNTQANAHAFKLSIL